METTSNDAQPQTRPDGSPMTSEWKPGDPLRTDGPTLEEWIASGYSKEAYPPAGYAPVPSAPATAQNNKRRTYFKKVMAQTPLFVGSEKVQYVIVAGNIGLIDCEEGSTLALELSKLAMANGGKGRAGVVAIDAATFNDLKKKPTLTPSLQRPKPKLQVLSLPSQKKKPQPSESSKASVAPVAAANSATISPSVGGRVGPDGGSGAGGESSAPPVPASQPPVALATAKKSVKMPVTKKTESRSLSGGVPEPDPVEE